jgi:hypothetical protein
VDLGRMIRLSAAAAVAAAVLLVAGTLSVGNAAADVAGPAAQSDRASDRASDEATGPAGRPDPSEAASPTANPTEAVAAASTPVVPDGANAGASDPGRTDPGATSAASGAPPATPLSPDQEQAAASPGLPGVRPVTVMAVGDSVCRRSVAGVFERLAEYGGPGWVTSVGLVWEQGMWHQCRSGWNTASMAGLDPPPHWVDQSLPDAVAAATVLRPQVTYVMAGVNEFPQGYTVPEATDHLRLLLSRLIAVNPGSRYVVSTALGFDPKVLAYDRAVPGVVAEFVRAGADVTGADLEAGFAPTDLVDGVHPTAEGTTKLAAAWTAALIPVIDRIREPESRRVG